MPRTPRNRPEAEDVARVPADPVEVWRTFSRVSKAWYRLAERNLEPLGLSVLEVRALRTLSEAGPSPMVAVADELAVTQAAITGMIDRLERMGLVTRLRQTRDRRVVQARTTPAGERMLRRAIRLHRDFVRESLGALSPEEAVRFEDMLGRLGEFLARMESPEREPRVRQRFSVR